MKQQPPRIKRYRELRDTLGYSAEDKDTLKTVVKEFTKLLRTEYKDHSELQVNKELRQHLLGNDYRAVIIYGYYVLWNDNPDDPVNKCIPRTWVVVDSRYIIDVNALKYHPDDHTYWLVIQKVGHKDYRYARLDPKVVRQKIKLKKLLNNPLQLLRRK